jgi:hypothetical protein
MRVERRTNPSWESRVVTGMVQHPGADEPRRAY